jgi:hypothetical protein
MKKFLFLDFDGVLHGERDPHMAKLPLLEQYLLQMPQLDIVISSTWREVHPLAKLQSMFPPSLRTRVVGVTPILGLGYDTGTRQREIEAYLSQANLRDGATRWIALDDIKWFFDDACPNLILVDPRRGFGHEEGGILLKWYGSAEA